MLEIERLKRTNAMQKSQLAELEARVVSSERGVVDRDKDRGRSAPSKPSAGELFNTGFLEQI